MNRQEFLLKCYDLRWTQSELEEDLDTLIQSEIEAHEAAQWLPYPENKPESNIYLCWTINGFIMLWYSASIDEWQTIDSYKINNVMAFRELPKSYQP